MDIEIIELYEAQIKSFEVMMQSSYSPYDISWYQSQIKYLKSKIKDLSGD